MAALTMSPTSVILTGSLSSTSFSPSILRRNARLSTGSRAVRLVVKANKDNDDVKEKILDISEQIEADATKSNKGAVREATMANKPEDGEAQAGHILSDVEEKIGDVVAAVKNALGGNEGFDSEAEKGAFTTPQREAQKAKYNLDASNTRPPQKTVDLDNPFDKKN